MITLNLTSFHGWALGDRRQLSGAYFKALTNLMRPDSGPAGRILGAIGSALTGEDSTVDIDVSGADLRALTSVTMALESFGKVAPKESPPDFVRQFIQDLEAADPRVAAQRRLDGHPAV